MRRSLLRSSQSGRVPRATWCLVYLKSIATPRQIDSRTLAPHGEPNNADRRNERIRLAAGKLSQIVLRHTCRKIPTALKIPSHDRAVESHPSTAVLAQRRLFAQKAQRSEYPAPRCGAGLGLRVIIAVGERDRTAGLQRCPRLNPRPKRRQEWVIGRVGMSVCVNARVQVGDQEGS